MINSLSLFMILQLLYCVFVLVDCVSDMIAEEPEKISGWFEMTFYSFHLLSLSLSIYSLIS